MRRRSPLSIGIGLALLAVPLIVAPASARSEHARIIEYWTPARIASAVPRDFERDGARFVPRARPGSGGGVTGASWTRGGDVPDQTGKVFFSMAGGNWQCSGSVVNDDRSAYSIVLTAGHCAVDETTGVFATNWMFMPNWDADPATFATACDDTLYGCWTAQGLVVHSGFRFAGSFNVQAVRHDWAFAVVGAGGHGDTQLDTTVGSYPIQFNSVTTTVSNGDRLSAFGYPAAGKYHGNDLTWCAGKIFQDSGTSNTTWGMACGMTGGSSGGPWFDGLNETNGLGGTLSSLNSYGYNGVKNMYGPKFNSNTEATYNAADSATGNTTVN